MLGGLKSRLELIEERLVVKDILTESVHNKIEGKNLKKIQPSGSKTNLILGKFTDFNQNLERTFET
jgi:hypothetical protein